MILTAVDIKTLFWNACPLKIIPTFKYFKHQFLKIQFLNKEEKQTVNYVSDWHLA